MSNRSNGFFRFILLIKQYKYKEGILIFSEPRGGSTWLMEILNEIPKTVINWEPLHTKYGVVPSNLNWGDRPFISANDRSKSHYKIIKKMLTLSLNSPWTLQFTNIKKIFYGKTIITKFVRANLLLPWVLENFKFRYKPILLIRHPIVTCLSQINTFHQQNYRAIFKIPTSINSKRFDQHKEFLDKLESTLELKIAVWCINNIQTLKNPSICKKVLFVFYEDLFLFPQKEVNKILIEYGKSNLFESTFKEFNYKKMSRSNFNNKKITTSEEQLNQSFLELDENSKEKVQKIFDYFNFDLYDAFSPYPQKRLI